MLLSGVGRGVLLAVRVNVAVNVGLAVGVLLAVGVCVAVCVTVGVGKGEVGSGDVGESSGPLDADGPARSQSVARVNASSRRWVMPSGISE